MSALVPAARLVERNFTAYRRMWWLFISGFAEPFLYLLSMSVGVSKLVGHVGGLSYAEFVAPGLLASSAMNGAIFDSTFNVFYRLKYGRVYEAMLATPMRAFDVAAGELGWALLRGTIYAFAFVLIMWGMGLVLSPWAVLAVPAAMLIGMAFSGLGMALTTFLRTWQDFDYINLALLPLFLLSATFFPLATYPRALELAVQALPLYHGVEMIRALTTGHVGWQLLGHAAALAAFGALGLAVTARRFARLLLT